MNPEDIVAEVLGGNLVILLLAGFVILCILLGVRIVPQSEKVIGCN